VHIPPKLVRALKESGHEADHCYAIGLAAATDMDVWNYASQHDALIVTKDADFAALASARTGPAVIHVRLGNSSNKALMTRFFAELPEILKLIDLGHRVVALD